MDFTKSEKSIAVEDDFLGHLPHDDALPSYSAEEESRVVWKLDLWLMPLMMITYFLQSYDKAIMSSATQFGFTTDLGLSKVIGHTSKGKPITDNSKYANASMIFFVGYLAGTYPMTYLCQRYSYTRVVAISTFVWGGILMTTDACKNYSGILANRFFLGFVESTIAPAFTVLVSFWWTREEQMARTGLWYCCVGLATTLAPLINWGLGQITGPLKPWQPMFLILGGITSSWAIVLWFLLPDNPYTTKGLNEKERKIVLDRLGQNDAGSISRHFKKAQFFEAFRDYKVWSSMVIIICCGIPTGALGNFGTLIISGFGFSHFHSLALSSSFGAVVTISILLSGFITRAFRNTRQIFIIVVALISVAGTAVCWLGPKDHKGTMLGGLLLMSAQVGAVSLSISTISNNIAGHTKKTTASAAVFVAYCLGNIAGPILYGKSPAPAYRVGFLSSFICLIIAAATAAVTLVLLYRENQKRQKLDSSFRTSSDDEEDLTDFTNKNFRYLL